MSDLKSTYEFLTSLSIDNLAKHFTNISELYLKPVRSWKKIISYRKESYNLFLLFVVYYSVIISFIISDYRYVIPVTVLELVLTVIPFSFLYLPFVFFSRRWNKKIQSNRLFRLLFVLKIQFNILLVGFLLLAQWSGIESLYIVIENFIWIILMIFISAFPLLLNLRAIQKVLWIFTNYLFSLIFFIMLFLGFSSVPDLGLLIEKITVQTPTVENLDFEYEYNYSDLLLDDKYYIALFNENGKELFLRNTQFATPKLTLDIMEMSSRNLKEKIGIMDSIKQRSGEGIKPKSISVNSEKISTIRLDSLRVSFNELFYADFNLTDSVKAHARFDSNRKLYNLLNTHLSYYDSIYKTNKAIKKIIETEPLFLVRAKEGGFVAVFELNDQTTINRNAEIKKLRNEFERRETYSTLLQKIYTFPINLIIEKLD